MAKIKYSPMFANRPKRVSKTHKKLSEDKVIRELTKLIELGQDAFENYQQARTPLPKNAKEQKVTDAAFQLGLMCLHDYEKLNEIKQEESNMRNKAQVIYPDTQYKLTEQNVYNALAWFETASQYNDHEAACYCLDHENNIHSAALLNTLFEYRQEFPKLLAYIDEVSDQTGEIFNTAPRM